MSFNIHCCAICTTLRGMTSKKTFSPFFIWESYRWWSLWSLSSEIYLIEILDKTQTVDYYSFFKCTYFYHHFYFHSIRLIGWQEFILFFNMHHKTCYHQIDAEELTSFISWIHKINHPFDYYDPIPNTSWDTGHHSYKVHLVKKILGFARAWGF